MADLLALLQACVGFDLDQGNAEKNWIRHQVSQAECEELFLNDPLVVAPDEKHSGAEPRYYVLGQTDTGRALFVVMTIRDRLIRVISARDMSRREAKEYQRAQNDEENGSAPAEV